LQRRFPIIDVRVIQIDSVHAEPLQALVAFRFDLPGGKPHLDILVGKTNFRRHEQLTPVAACLHPAPQDGFAFAALNRNPPGVDIRRVDERAARVYVLIQQGKGRGFVLVRAENIAPKHNALTCSPVPPNGTVFIRSSLK